MRLALAIAVGFIAGGVYSITAHADVTPRYEYVCNDAWVDKHTGRIMCTVRELLYPTQAPWDPEPGANLADQIPHWTNEADKVCGGHLPRRELKAWHTTRC